MVGLTVASALKFEMSLGVAEPNALLVNSQDFVKQSLARSKFSRFK